MGDPAAIHPAPCALTILIWFFIHLFFYSLGLSQPASLEETFPSCWGGSSSSLFVTSLRFLFGRSYSPTRDKGFSWPETAQPREGNALPKKLNNGHFVGALPASFHKHPCQQLPVFGTALLELSRTDPAAVWHPTAADLFCPEQSGERAGLRSCQQEETRGMRFLRVLNWFG